MKLRMFLLFVLSIAFLNIASAQDKIYESDGGIINAVVKQISTETVIYKRYDNPTGPDYSIKKSDVQKIKYQNGTEDIFGGSSIREVKEQPVNYDANTKRHVNYKNNILSIAPFQFTENGLGFSLGYERSIDKPGVVAFCLPVVLIFSQTNNDNYYNGVNTNHTDLMYYAMPGIKIYPTGNKAKTKYAIGPSAVIESGQKTSYSYDQLGNAYVTQQQRFVLGLLVQNYLNINPTPHLFLGIEMGIGASYINRLAGIDQGTAFLIQGAFKIGYRF